MRYTLQGEIFDLQTKAFTECSWRRGHQGPATQNRQFLTESPNLLTFVLYEYKWFLGPSSEAVEHDFLNTLIHHVFFFFIILEYVLKWYFFSPSNTLHDFCGWGWKSRLPFINPKKTKKWSEKWARFYLEVSRGMLPQKTVKVRITMLISTNSETDFVQLLSPVR